MKRIFIYFSLFTCFYLTSLSTKAQGEIIVPTIDPTITVVDDYGEATDTITRDSHSIEAPAKISFKANPADNDGWTATYEWQITRSQDGSTTTYLDRFDEDTEYTFEESGSYSVVCYATFSNGELKQEYTEEYWEDVKPFTFSIATSHLEMPNAFSPNGDSYNDTYGPKGTQENTKESANRPKSIIEFHMTIFNRWGQKLYETRDLYQGWDGTFHGRPCKDGVYYALVTATGADGIKYTFKKDVNLLRTFQENEGSTTTEQ